MWEGGQQRESDDERFLLSFIHKYHLKCDSVFTKVLTLDKGNPVDKQDKNNTIIHLFIVENDTILNMCVLKYECEPLRFCLMRILQCLVFKSVG